MQLNILGSGVSLIGVQFRRAGKIYDFSPGDHVVQAGDDVVVDTDRGLSLAKVVAVKYVEKSELGEGIKPILRVATRTDIADTQKLDPDYVTKYTRERVVGLKLEMRILKSEIQFGGNKVVVYFSAPGRIDFRELVKDLAGGLRARVELKQVGARDEAKVVGGLGICGREYCCSSFLRDFVPVSIKMAKNQNLALNPSKVSGGCGRLLCCLTYENDVYTLLRKKLPPRGVRVRFGDEQTGTILKGDVLNQTVTVETDDGQQQTIPLTQVEILEKGSAQSQPQEGDNWGEDIDLESLEGIED